MARHRSRSLVQSIAQEIHENGNGNFNTPKGNGTAGKSSGVLNKELPHKPRLTRSQSIPELSHNKPKKQDDVILLDPFTALDYETVWNQYLALEYNSYPLQYDFSTQDTLNKVQHINQLQFHKILTVNLNQLKAMKRETDQVNSQLLSVRTKYFHIEEQTEDFNNQSLALVDKEHQLSEKVEAINAVLKNFESLDEITKKLSVPNNIKLIRSNSFKKILQDLNHSLEFFNHNTSKDASNLKFKNIEMYKIKFRQCMTRSLTLIKDYLINELKKIERTIMSSNGDIVDILIYKQFDNYLQEFKQEFYNFPNLIEIYMVRIETYHEEEYKGLLMEVVYTYFKIRLNLVNISKQLAKFTDDSLVKFTQDNLSFIKKTLIREFKLFKDWFGLNHDNVIPEFINTELYNYFRDLIDPFYDIIRHRVLKETNISVLCQLMNLLQKYYEFEDHDQEKINFGEIFEPIFNDVQSRLIFRIQIYVDNRLVPYKPSPEDLKIGNRNPQKRKNSNSSTATNVLDEEFEENLFEELYLPLGKALTILSNIYELINSIVFDDLAHYIVHSCIEILKNGAYTLCVKHLGIVDAKLYYLKNLIILKYQLNNFDIQFVRTETSLDFTSGLNELYSIIRNGEILINVNKNGIFSLISKTVPKIINNMIDAKLEIELEINNSINELLTEYLNLLIDPLADTHRAKSEVEKFNDFKQRIHDLLPNFKSTITNYINDLNILKFLFNNLIEILVNYYQNYYSNLTPSDDLNLIMEPEIFINFFNNFVDDLLDDQTLSNNLMDIKPLLKFDEELNEIPQGPPEPQEQISEDPNSGNK